MKILIDIVHAADVCFYKEAIQKLKKSHHLTVFVRPRGDLVAFAKRELDIPIRVVGRYSGNRLGKIGWAIHRVLCLTALCFRHSYDVVTSHGGFYIAIAAKIVGIRSVLFYDTYEYRSVFELCRYFATVFVIPSSLGVRGKNIRTFYGYKELAYLNNFQPSECVLKKWGVEKKNYVFVRHIAHSSLDCWQHDHEDVLESIVKYLNAEDYPIIASIEKGADKIPLLSQSARMIDKPTTEMHSLMFYSRCVISSGGTVAREGALLGVPTFYIGNLYMRVDQELIWTRRLLWPEKDRVVFELDRILKTPLNNHPLHIPEWEDTTEVIVCYLTEETPHVSDPYCQVENFRLPS